MSLDEVHLYDSYDAMTSTNQIVSIHESPCNSDLHSKCREEASLCGVAFLIE